MGEGGFRTAASMERTGIRRIRNQVKMIWEPADIS